MRLESRIGSPRPAFHLTQPEKSRARLAFRSAACLIVGLVVGCASHNNGSSTKAFDVDFRAESDTGANLEGVVVSSSRQLLGTTDHTGYARFKIGGLEGDMVNIQLKCPNDYLPPNLPISMRLTHTQSVAVRAAQPLKISAVCTRVTRDVAVVVHADQGGSIPVSVDGQRATITTADGYAQLLLRVDRTVRSVTLSLDTNEQPQLLPKNPKRQYELPPGDSILVYDLKFVKQRPALGRPTAKREIRHIPYRVD